MSIFNDTTGYRSALMDRPGASPAPDENPAENPNEVAAPVSGLDTAGVAWHYGNPLGEQKHAHTGLGIVVDRSQRAVIKVEGEDAAAFLNNLTSQKLDDAPLGFAAQLLDMDVRGHVLHHAHVVRVDDGLFYLDTSRPEATSLIDFLTKMIFWSKVTVEEVDAAVLTVLGPGAAMVAESSVEDALAVRRVDWPGIARADLVVPTASLEDTVAALEKMGVRLAGLMAFTAERVRATEPEIRADLDEKAIAHEVPWWIGRGVHAGAVHLNKGCYRGQETVARVENLGRSPRLLVVIQIDGSAPTQPVPGDTIVMAGSQRAVGRIGTVIDDYEEGPIGVALVKRSALNAPLATGANGEVAVAVDKESLPAEDVDGARKAGREAIERLRGGH